MLILTLCKEVYHCSPSELKKKMDLTEFREWVAYYRINGTDQRRKDLHCGIVASSIFNSQRKTRSSKLWKAEDFIPVYNHGNNGKPKSAEEMSAKLHQALSRFYK